MSKGPAGNTTGENADGNGAARMPDADRILRVVLAQTAASRRSALLARDVEQAVAELALEGRFHPHGLAGPFILHLAVENGRLVFDIHDADDRRLGMIGLALGPFRSLVKDYLLIVESHANAASGGHAARIEAVDMGRRGLHNEGAELVIERLAGKIDIDFETARRLFTLVCVLQLRF